MSPSAPNHQDGRATEWSRRTHPGWRSSDVDRPSGTRVQRIVVLVTGEHARSSSSTDLRESGVVRRLCYRAHSVDCDVRGGARLDDRSTPGSIPVRGSSAVSATEPALEPETPRVAEQVVGLHGRRDERSDGNEQRNDQEQRLLLLRCRGWHSSQSRGGSKPRKRASDGHRSQINDAGSVRGSWTVGECSTTPSSAACRENPTGRNGHRVNRHSAGATRDADSRHTDTRWCRAVRTRRGGTCGWPPPGSGGT